MVCANQTQRFLLQQAFPGRPVTCFSPAAPDPVGRGEEAYADCLNTMALQMAGLLCPLTGRRFLVRPAVPEDLSSVAGIEQLTFPRPFSRAGFAMSLDEPSRLLLTAQTAGGETAGYLLARILPDEPPAAEILTVAAEESHRRQGVGRALMQALDRALQARGVRRCLLEVRESNGPARQLYAGCGYAEIGVRRHYYDRPDEDARIMEKNL